MAAVVVPDDDNDNDDEVERSVMVVVSLNLKKRLSAWSSSARAIQSSMTISTGQHTPTDGRSPLI